MNPLKVMLKMCANLSKISSKLGAIHIKQNAIQMILIGCMVIDQTETSYSISIGQSF